MQRTKGMQVCLISTLHHVDLAKVSLTDELIQLMAGSLPQPGMAGFQAKELPGPSPLLLHTNSFVLTTTVGSEDPVQLSWSLSFPESRTADDLRISFCTQTAVDTLGSMRQTNQEPTARNRQGSSLPDPWDRHGWGDGCPTLASGQRSPRKITQFHQPMPPKAAKRLMSVPSKQAEPGQAQLSKSTPNLMEQSLDSSWLLRIRAHIHTRLGGSEMEAEIQGREGSRPSLCPRPVRTPKLLAPLDHGQREVAPLPMFRDPWPPKVTPLLPSTLTFCTRREWWSRRATQVLPITWRGSDGRSSSSASSQGSLDLEASAKFLRIPPNQKDSLKVEHPVTSASENYDMDLPLSVCSALEDTAKHLGPVDSDKSQGTDNKSAVESIFVIYQTEWKENCEMLPRRAETKLPHDIVSHILETTCYCQDNDGVTLCNSSCVEETILDNVNDPEELLEEDIRPGECEADSVIPESHRDNILQLKDCDNKGQSARNPLDTKQLVSTVNITMPESDHFTEVKHKAMKMLKNKDRACSVASLTNQLSNAQPRKEQNWRNRKSKSHPRNTNAPAPSKASSRRPPDVIVSGKEAVKLGVYTTNAEKVSKKRSPLPSLHDAPVEALRENVKRTSGDKHNSTKFESTGQKQLVQQEIRSTWQPKRAAVAENLRAKSAVEYITYTDMFQEINGRDEGPAIYEMFATPVYTNLRLSTMYEKVYNREIKSAPASKNQVRRNNKCPKPLEKKQNKSQGVKVKNRAGVLPKGKSCRLLVRDFEQENVVLVNRPIQPTKREMVFGGKNGQSEGQRILDQHVEESNLYVIEENLSDQQSETAALHNTPMDRTSPSSREVLPKPLLEFPVSSSQSVEENTVATLEGQHTTPQPLQRNTPKGQYSETKYSNMKKEAANPAHELRSCSIPAEAKISSWTSEGCGQTLSPVFQKFPDGAGEGVVTDDLLQCLAKELTSLEGEDLTLQPENGGLCKGVSEDAAQVKTDQPLPEGRAADGMYADDAIMWTKGEVLGRGAYGTVYCGLTSKGQLIAVKQVALDDCDPASAESEYQRLQVEVDLLKTLCHNNIVGFLGTALQDGVVSIFMEYVPGGSIASILQRFGPLPEKVLALYTQQILEGVAYLHRNRVIHRDLKGNNIMLMPDGVIKLIDFGCARRVSRLTHSSDRSDLLKSVHGTPYWMAPEVINETGHGRKSDIWSIGCTVFEMATGKPPLAHMNKLAALFYIGARRGLMPTLPDEFSGEARNFVRSCLTSDQKERPSAEELLKHPFVPQRETERQSAADLAPHPGAPSVTASRGFKGNSQKGPSH